MFGNEKRPLQSELERALIRLGLGSAGARRDRDGRTVGRIAREVQLAVVARRRIGSERAAGRVETAVGVGVGARAVRATREICRVDHVTAPWTDDGHGALVAASDAEVARGIDSGTFGRVHDVAVDDELHIVARDVHDEYLVDSAGGAAPRLHALKICLREGHHARAEHRRGVDVVAGHDRGEARRRAGRCRGRRGRRCRRRGDRRFAARGGRCCAVRAGEGCVAELFGSRGACLGFGRTALGGVDASHERTQIGAAAAGREREAERENGEDGLVHGASEWLLDVEEQVDVIS